MKCKRCFQEALSDRTLCERCKNLCDLATKKTKQKWKDDGLCLRCGKITVAGRKMCQKHLNEVKKYNKKRTNKWKKFNLCIKCGKEKVNSWGCECCYLKNTAIKRLGENSSARWTDLKEIFDFQKGICPYTGRKLILGVDTELDHIIPVSKNGSSKNDNLQWVYRPVNKMKSDLIDFDFKNLILVIYNHITKQANVRNNT